MRTDYMRDLVALHEFCNFSRAAESRFISQPALSRHIADMEKELGLQLVTRNKHSVRFTDAGEQVYQRFKKILRSYDNLLVTLSDYQGGLYGQLRLGMLYYTIREDYGKILSVFSEQYPKVEIKRWSCQPQDIFHLLEEDRIDVGPMTRADYPDGGFLRYQDYLKGPIEVLLPVTHPLAQKEQVFLQDIAEEPILFLRDDPYSNYTIEDAMARCNFSVSKKAYTDNIDTAPFAIQRGKGLFLKAAGFSVPGYEQELTAKTLMDPDLYMIKSFAYRADNTNPLLPIFLNLAKQLL